MNDPNPCLSRTPTTHLAETVPPRYHRLYRRAKGLDGRPPSRTAALRVLCLECQGYSDNVTRAIRECEVVCCPLYEVRPYQTDNDSDDNTEAGNGETGETGESTVSALSPEEFERQESLHQKRVEALIKARAARAANRAKE